MRSIVLHPQRLARRAETLGLALMLSACSSEIVGAPDSGGTASSPAAGAGQGATPSGGANGGMSAAIAGTGATAGAAGAAAGAPAAAGGVASAAGGTSSGGAPLDCSAPKLGGSPLRRLTRREYNNVVRDLLGDTARPADRFVPESEQSGFTNGAESTLLSAVVVDDFERAATALAKEATVSAKLGSLVGCDPSLTAGQDACAKTFIRGFGARAFRRTLDDAQIADYEALYTSTKASYGFGTAIELVLRAMLQSPYFLYRIELGQSSTADSGIVALTPEETAVRLSFLLWGSVPDAALMQAAREGKLNTAADVRAQAERMLSDDRGSALFSDFHVQWGQLEGLPNQTKPAPFTPEMGRLLIEETEHFVDQTLRKGDGSLLTLLTSPVTYLNQPLAQFYGVTGVSGSEFQSVTLPAGQRAGLLTQGSFMANFAHGSEPSQVLRGKFILTQLACSPPPPPPDNVDTTLPAPDPAKSGRQQLVELTGEKPCSGCHSLLNPAGFAFEHFDGLGRYRTTERGLAIDSSSAVVFPADMAGMYRDHDDFLRALANSATVRSCLASKWFIYTHGRIPEPDDACSLSATAENFKSSGNIRELVLAMTETPAFRYLRPAISGAKP